MHNQCFVLSEQFVAMLTWDLSNGVDFIVLVEIGLSSVCLATNVAFMDSCRAGMDPLVDLQGIGNPQIFCCKWYTSELTIDNGTSCSDSPIYDETCTSYCKKDKQQHQAQEL